MMTRAALADYAIEIRELYLWIADQILNPRPPELRNTDGDPIELTTLTYELDVEPPDAFDCLEPLSRVGDERYVDEETRDATGALTGAIFNWMKAGNRKHEAWDNTILGTLRLTGTRLTVEVNSERRRRRITKEIAKRLGAHARLTGSEVVDVADALAASHAADADAAPIDDARTPEIEALEADLLREHWDAWVDTTIPALGNRTPRQAARTPRGRERLEALLADFERMAEQHSSTRPPDIATLRRTLKLP